MEFTRLMNWILGRKDADKNSAKKVDYSEKRTSQRLDYSEGVVEIPGVGEFPLIDLAHRGLALNVMEHKNLSELRPGMTLPVKIFLGKTLLETDLKICSWHDNKIGCSFSDLPAGHSRVLNDFLKPRMLGTSLHEVNSRDAGLRRFHGDDGTQILYWSENSEGFDKADFYFMDYLISFNGKEGSLRTGFVPAHFKNKKNPGMVEPDTVIYHDSPSYRALKLGHGIFEKASLPEDVYLNLAGIMFREEKCTFSRVILGEKDQKVTFEISDESGPRVLQVASLCSTAISLILPDSSKKVHLAPGTVINGLLRLPDCSLSADFKVVFQHDFLIGGGLRFQKDSDAELMASFLMPRLLGKSLEVVASPAENRPFAPRGSSVSLSVGIHNTHLLSLIMPTDNLLYGRLVFSDRILVWEKENFSAYSCQQGFVFPTDWDIPLNEKDRISHKDPVFINTVKEILQSSRLPHDVRCAWLKAIASLQ